MSRKQRKTFPPGTFIPLPQRLMAIAQLCLAFSLLLWYVTQPFMGEYFALRSRMLLYEYVMGKTSTSDPEKREQRAQKFEQLAEKEMLLSDYQRIQAYATRPGLQKIAKGLQGLLLELPPFEQAWIFFSVVISLLILMKQEGAKEVAWLLPLIVLAYGADNLTTGKSPVVPPDLALFPSEQMIVQNYLERPLGTHPTTQREQLQKGWNRYLIKHWPSKAGNEEQRLQDGEYNFTVARLLLLHPQTLSEWLPATHERLSPVTLILYVLWNGCFAWIVSRPIKGSRKRQAIPQS